MAKRSIEDISESEKQSIVDTIGLFLHTEGLNEFHDYLFTKTTLNEQIEWLIKYRVTFEKSPSPTFKEIELIEEFTMRKLELFYSDGEYHQKVKSEPERGEKNNKNNTNPIDELSHSITQYISMVKRNRFALPNIYKAFESYKELFGSLEDFYGFELAMSKDTFGENERKGKILVRPLSQLKREELAELEKLIEDDSDENEDDIENIFDYEFSVRKGVENDDKIKKKLIIVNPLPELIREDLYKFQLQDMNKMANAIKKSFPKRSVICKQIPSDIRFLNKRGASSDFPYRKILVQNFWKQNKDRIMQLAKDKSGFRNDNKIVEIVKSEFEGAIDHIPPRTLKDWLGLYK